MSWARLIVLLWIVPSRIAAAEALVLTEADFLAAAASNPASERVLGEERGLAEAEAMRAALWPNPSLAVSREEPDGATETAAVLSWPFPHPGRRSAAREGAAKAQGAARGRLEHARWALRLELRADYSRWAVAWERRELLTRQLARVAGLAETARRRADAGEMPGIAARRLGLEANQLVSDLAEAEAVLALARAGVVARLSSLGERARPMLPVLPPEASTPPELPSRPDLVALERERERAEAQLRLSRMILDAPSLQVGWKRLEERGASASGVVVGLGWTLPLFDRRRAEGLEAEARLNAARGALELARARAEAEREGTLAAYHSLRERAERAGQAITDLDPLTAGAEAAYQAGELDLTDLLDTLRATFAARLEALEARAAALGAARALDAASGPSLFAVFGGQP